MLRSAAGDRDLKSFQHIQGLLVEDGVIGGGEAGIHQDLCLGQSGLTITALESTQMWETRPHSSTWA